MISFRQLNDALVLAEERARVRRLLDTDHCGLDLRDYRDAIAVVLPPYRQWLTNRHAAIDKELIGLGIDVTSPVAWLNEQGIECDFG